MPDATDFDGIAKVITAVATLCGSIAGPIIGAMVFLGQRKATQLTQTTHDLVNGQAAALAAQNAKLSDALSVAAHLEGEQKGAQDERDRHPPLSPSG